MILPWPAIAVVAVSFPIGIPIGVTSIGGAAPMTPFLIVVPDWRAAAGTDGALCDAGGAAGFGVQSAVMSRD